jgi:alpha-glucosidase
VKLDFLPAGRYTATIWEDGATPNNVTTRAVDVTARDALALQLAGAGGAAVIIEAR